MRNSSQDDSIIKYAIKKTNKKTIIRLTTVFLPAFLYI